MRIDKFLKNSRLIKRRTVAKEACDQGRILINDKTVKPGAEVKPGDIVSLTFGEKTIQVEVLQLLDHVRKEDAENMYRQLDA